MQKPLNCRLNCNNCYFDQLTNSLNAYAGSICDDCYSSCKVEGQMTVHDPTSFAECVIVYKLSISILSDKNTVYLQFSANEKEWKGTWNEDACKLSIVLAMTRAVHHIIRCFICIEYNLISKNNKKFSLQGCHFEFRRKR